jgi:DNA-binding NtrC family response regulator
VKTILILEDDKSSLSVLTSALEGAYAIVHADTPEDALHICEFMIPNLFIAGTVRSAMSGIETICRVHERHPALPLLLISKLPPGSDKVGCIERLMKNARFRLLREPFTMEVIRSTVKNLLAGNSDSA